MMQDNLEKRYAEGLSIREDGGATIISGIAVPFYDGTAGSEYELEKGYFERISPDCKVDLDNIEACIMHDRTRLIGMTPDTLKLRRTNRGIEYDLILDESTDSQDAKIMVKNKKLRGASIQFSPTEVRHDRKSVTITGMRITHIALVSQPAYEKASAYLRFIEIDKEKELMAIYEDKLSHVLASLPQAANTKS